MTWIDEPGIETSVIGSHGMREDIFIFPLNVVPRFYSNLWRIEVHLLHDDKVVCAGRLSVLRTAGRSQKKSHDDRCDERSAHLPQWRFAGWNDGSRRASVLIRT